MRRWEGIRVLRRPGKSMLGFRFAVFTQTSDARHHKGLLRFMDRANDGGNA